MIKKNLVKQGIS